MLLTKNKIESYIDCFKSWPVVWFKRFFLFVCREVYINKCWENYVITFVLLAGTVMSFDFTSRLGTYLVILVSELNLETWKKYSSRLLALLTYIRLLLDI